MGLVALQVANCSETVSPILARSLALIARQSLSSTFEVYVQSPLASNLSCLATLLDSQVEPTILARQVKGKQGRGLPLRLQCLLPCHTA